jgi:integrase
MRVRGIKRYRHPKTGIVYTYHRATGTRLQAEFGTAAFMAEIAALEGGPRPKPNAKAGTMGGLFEFYRKSASFQALKPRVRRGYEDAILWMLQGIADMPLHKVTPGFVAQMRDHLTKQRSWHFANEVRKVLSVAFSIACEAGIVNANPAKDTRRAKRPKSLPRRNRPWTFEERVAVMRKAPPHLKLPIALSMYMGWREGDVLRLPKRARKGMWFSLVTQKTGEYAEMPIPRPLVAILKECDAHGAMTLCANSAGKPWTQCGFRSSLRAFMKRLERDGEIGQGLTFHGLRHTAATVLKEAGASDDDIAAWLTHSPQMARHYSQDASKRERRKAIVKTFDL